MSTLTICFFELAKKLLLSSFGKETVSKDALPETLTHVSVRSFVEYSCFLRRFFLIEPLAASA